VKDVWSKWGAIPGAALMALALGWSFYRYGMFFDGDFYPLEIGLIAAAVLAAAACLACGRPVRPLLMAPFALAALYALELLVGPASWKGTADGWIRWTAYGSWTILLGLFLSNERNRIGGWLALQAAGLFAVGGGLAGWFGWIDFPEMLFRSSNAEMAARGVRLAGFFQYPNAFGALAAAFALIQWQLAASRDRRIAAWAAATAVPAVCALLLTESRGALAALAAGLAVSWLTAGRGRRGTLLAAAGISLGWGAAAARAAFAAMQAGTPAKGAGMLLIATLAGAGMLWLLGRLRGGGAPSRFARAGAAAASDWGGFALLAAGAAAMYGLLFANGGARIGRYETAAARSLYYGDALRIIRDHFWLGSGGQSWRILYGLYQRRPYVGNEVHSGYLEVWLDAGIAGFAALTGMLAAYARRLRPQAASAWGPAAVLLAHAAIDFDWSFGAMWLFLLAWIALHFPPAGGRRRLRPAAAAALAAAVFAAASLPAAWRSNAAARAYDAAIAASGTAARVAELRAALVANPAWNRIRLELAPLLPAAERAAVLAAGLRYEPQSAPLHLQLGFACAELGDVAQAEAHLREGLRLGRFNRDAQDGAVARMAGLAERLAEAGDRESARRAAEAAVGFYERYRETYRNADADGGEALFSSAKVNAARAMIVLGQRKQAEDLLREVASGPAEDWREEAEKLLRGLSG